MLVGGRAPLAWLAIALAGASAVACRKHEAPRAADAAIAIDAAPPVDAAPPAIDAALRPAATATRLAASGDSTCAVLSDLTVRCWGGNAHGQLGNRQTADSASPVAPEIRAVVDLQLADATACALLDDASVACWGRIAWHGRAEDLLRPTGVPGVIGVKQIFVLPGRACARVANDSLVCWGNVDARGHFAAGPTHRAPTPVVGLDHIAGMTAEGAFSDDGRMWRWGKTGAPERVDVEGVQELAANGGTLCARLAGGRVACVDDRRCGPSAAAAPAAPVRPTAPARAAPSGGRKGTPGKIAPGAAPARPARAGESRGLAVRVLPLAPARQLAAGLGLCAVTTAGRLQCSDGCRKVSPMALDRVDRAERVERVTGRCAQLRSGAVACFDGGKLVPVPGVERVTALAVGRAHACALSGGAILCWGDHGHGQLGEFAVTQ